MANVSLVFGYLHRHEQPILNQIQSDNTDQVTTFNRQLRYIFLFNRNKLTFLFCAQQKKVTVVVGKKLYVYCVDFQSNAVFTRYSSGYIFILSIKPIRLQVGLVGYFPLRFTVEIESQSDCGFLSNIDNIQTKIYLLFFLCNVVYRIYCLHYYCRKGFKNKIQAVAMAPYNEPYKNRSVPIMRRDGHLKITNRVTNSCRFPTKFLLLN